MLALKNAESWNYAAFWAMVIYLGSVYLLSTFLFPHVPDDGDIELERHFENVRQVFMVALSVTFVLRA
jgi:hypothetical protein